MAISPVGAEAAADRQLVQPVSECVRLGIRVRAIPAAGRHDAHYGFVVSGDRGRPFSRADRGSLDLWKFDCLGDGIEGSEEGTVGCIQRSFGGPEVG